jgi:hypothetical protein
MQSEHEVQALLRRAGFSDVNVQKQGRLLWMPVLCYVARLPAVRT